MTSKDALPTAGDDVPNVLQAECSDQLPSRQISDFVDGKPLKNVKSKTEQTDINTDHVGRATSSKACSTRCEGSDSKKLENHRRESTTIAGAARNSPRSQGKVFLIKEYKVDTSSGVPELVKEAYDAKGRLIWCKITIGGHLGFNSNNRLPKVSGSAHEGCFELSELLSEEDAIREVAPISDLAAAVKSSLKWESSIGGLHQGAFGTKTKTEAAAQKNKAKSPRTVASVGKNGGSSVSPSDLMVSGNVKKGGITQSVLKFLGKLENASTKNNRMREKHVLASHCDLIKICLLSQGFLVAAFVLLAVISVNVAALLFAVVLFASR